MYRDNAPPRSQLLLLLQRHPNQSLMHAQTVHAQSTQALHCEHSVHAGSCTYVCRSVRGVCSQGKAHLTHHRPQTLTSALQYRCVLSLATWRRGQTEMVTHTLSISTAPPTTPCTRQPAVASSVPSGRFHRQRHQRAAYLSCHPSVAATLKRRSVHASTVATQGDITCCNQLATAPGPLAFWVTSSTRLSCCEVKVKSDALLAKPNLRRRQHRN